MAHDRNAPKGKSFVQNQRQARNNALIVVCAFREAVTRRMIQLLKDGMPKSTNVVDYDAESYGEGEWQCISFLVNQVIRNGNSSSRGLIIGNDHDITFAMILLSALHPSSNIGGIKYLSIHTSKLTLKSLN